MRDSSHLRGSERELISQTRKKSAAGDSAEPNPPDFLQTRVFYQVRGFQRPQGFYPPPFFSVDARIYQIRLIFCNRKDFSVRLIFNKSKDFSIHLIFSKSKDFSIRLIFSKIRDFSIRLIFSGCKYLYIFKYFIFCIKYAPHSIGAVISGLYV
jgi:hypothetical protein